MDLNKESEYSRLSGNTSTPSFHDGGEFVYPRSRRPWPSRHAIAYFLLIILNIASLGLLANQQYHGHPEDANKDCVRPLLTYSPSKEAGATLYESRTLYRSLNDNPYTGEPRPEHDDAWAKLVEPMTIILSPEEYRKADLGDDTLEMDDGSGYISEMAVYHELHCNKRIRRHLAMDYYYPNISADDLHRENVHIGIFPYFLSGDTMYTQFLTSCRPLSRVLARGRHVPRRHDAGNHVLARCAANLTRV